MVLTEVLAISKKGRLWFVDAMTKLHSWKSMGKSSKSMWQAMVARTNELKVILFSEMRQVVYHI